MASSVSRRRANEGPVFTSSKCPPDTGLKNSCELPFGFLWTPMCPNDESKIPVIDLPTDGLPPVLCLSCLAYMNPHCNVDFSTGKWTCPLCGQENVTDGAEFQDGSMLTEVIKSPIVEYHQQLSTTASLGDEDYCNYILMVDANIAPDDAQAIPISMESVLKDFGEEMPKIRLGLVVFDETVAMYQLGLSGIASSDVYVPLESVDDDALTERRLQLESRSYLQEIEPGMDLSSLRHCISAVFGITIGTETPLSRKEMLRKKKEARLRKITLEQNGKHQESVESPWVKHALESKKDHPKRAIGEAMQCALDLAAIGSNPARTSRILLFTNGCCNAGDFSVVAPVEKNKKSPSDKRVKKASPDHVDAEELSKSVELFDMTANFALETGAGIDVLCTGANELGLPAYQALVEPSGGYVIPHTSFTTSNLTQNLKFLLQSTAIARSQKSAEELDVADGKIKSEIIFDIRTDSFVDATHMVGPGTIVDVTEKNVILENERSGFAVGASLATRQGIKTNKLPVFEKIELSMTRIELPRVDPLTTIGVMLAVNDTIEKEDDITFFQTTVRFVDPSGTKMITRVCSKRLPVASDISEFVDGVDSEAVSVLLAKGAVYRALYGQEETENARDTVTAGDVDQLEKLSHEAQLDIDCTIARISGAFRLLGLETATRSIDLSDGSKEKSSQSSLDSAFPPQLAVGLKQLYHLRRGPLISPGPMLSMDDRATIRSLFLRFPLEDCISMMVPILLSSGSLESVSGSVATQPFPAETLALWDNSIIAADTHDSLFVWSGKHCTGPQYDGVREQFKNYVLEQTKDRFPMPELHLLYDGDSMSRRFTARLAPTHPDSEDHQIANFLALSTLPEQALEKLRSKFKFYDSSSDASFHAWFWNVSSATNASRDEGLSLCE